jgi:dGTPase
MMNSFAMREEQSRGRRFPEDEFCSERGLFERDIDRVIHSRAFKRLAGKTQVITGRRSDHHRTRLTHSIEVATLCRSVAGHLGLNPELAACLGFSHDLGHPPLGHAGEDVLNEICQRFGDSFEHNRHTLTIVDEFEQKYAARPGLNLSYEVREGIVKHSGDGFPAADPGLVEFEPALQPPLEAQLVDFCDEICYSYSDLDDALEAGFVTLEGDILEHLPEFHRTYRDMRDRYPGAEAKLLFNEALRRLMNATVRDMTEEIRVRIAARGIRTVEDIRRSAGRLVGYSADMDAWMRTFKEFLRARFYSHTEILARRQTDMQRIRRLFDVYDADPARLPARYREMIQSGPLPRHKVIVYYIAGFTDYFFSQVAAKLGL